jgi:hypothetical protein
MVDVGRQDGELAGPELAGSGAKAMGEVLRFAREFAMPKMSEIIEWRFCRLSGLFPFRQVRVRMTAGSCSL